MKTIIHVNQHHIKANAKEGCALPVLTVKDYKRNRRGQTAILMYNGIEMGRFVYRPDTPLSCGAKVWFESQILEVKVDA
jgi:hypothetical protein